MEKKFVVVFATEENGFELEKMVFDTQEEAKVEFDDIIDNFLDEEEEEFVEENQYHGTSFGEYEIIFAYGEEDSVEIASIIDEIEEMREEFIDECGGFDDEEE